MTPADTKILYDSPFQRAGAVGRRKLMALDDKTLAGWVRDGVMNMIDAHLASLNNFVALTARQGTETPAPAQTTAPA